MIRRGRLAMAKCHYYGSNTAKCGSVPSPGKRSQLKYIPTVQAFLSIGAAADTGRCRRHREGRATLNIYLSGAAIDAPDRRFPYRYR